MKSLIVLFMALVSLTGASASLRGLPRELCFASYGLEHLFTSRGQPLFISEAEAMKNPYVYQRYQIVVTRKIRDSNGFTNFSFVGHGKDIAGDEAAINGAGYIIGDRYHFEYQSNLLQFDAPNNAKSVYELNAIWEFSGTLVEGFAVRFNDVVSRPDHRYNDFDIGPIKRIPCSTY